MLRFLQLIRYPNLFIIALTLFVFKFYLIDIFFRETALSTTTFLLSVLSTLFLVGGGNIINDIFDQEIDRINKPEKVFIGRSISEAHANYLYIFFNLIGVALGFYIAHKIGRPNLAILPILISVLLYFYASYLKRLPVVGNLLVALLTGATIMVLGIFDLLPILSDGNRFLVFFVFKVLGIYALFAFFINLMREIVKDIEDVDGDYRYGVRSIPIILGKQRTSRLISIMALIPVLLIFFLTYIYLYKNVLMVLYCIFLLIAPLLYITFTAWNAKKKKEFKRLSLLLKLIMTLGIFSVFLLKFVFFKSV